MDRRSFLRGLAGLGAAALAPAVPFIPGLKVPVQRLREYATFAELVRTTLDTYSDRIAENVAEHNALLKHLRDRTERWTD